MSPLAGNSAGRNSPSVNFRDAVATGSDNRFPSARVSTGRDDTSDAVRDAIESMPPASQAEVLSHPHREVFSVSASRQRTVEVQSVYSDPRTVEVQSVYSDPPVQVQPSVIGSPHSSNRSAQPSNRSIATGTYATGVDQEGNMFSSTEEQ